MTSFFKDLYQECDKKHILTLASSSTFFLILTFVPALLLLTRFLGFFLGGESAKVSMILGYASHFLPPNLTGMMDILDKLLNNALFAQGPYTLFNFVFLTILSLGFINSIWRSIAIITEDQSMNSIKKIVKGVGTLAMGLGFLLLLFWMPVLFKGLSYLFKSDLFLAATRMFIRGGQVNFVDDGLITFFNILAYILFAVFISVLFKYLLHRGADWVSSFSSGVFFTFAIYVLKQLFFLYVGLAKDGLVQNYGASYSIVLVLIWCLCAMSLFYFSLILALLVKRYRLAAH
jgi:membrane protein